MLKQAAMSDQDRRVIDLLRNQTAMGVDELAQTLGVTATAVRQRLQRLMAAQLVRRETLRVGRGRPSHGYSLTDAGRRSGNTNFSDLALVLWDELRSVRDPELRRGMLRRIMERLATLYRAQVQGGSSIERMKQLANLFAERDIPFQVDMDGTLPVLKAMSCPYTELADQDRSVCAMERMLFSELVAQPLRLKDCRLDGAPCCTFEPHTIPVEVTT